MYCRLSITLKSQYVSTPLDCGSKALSCGSVKKWNPGLSKWVTHNLRSTVVHGFPHFGQLHWFPDPLSLLSLLPLLEENTLLHFLSWQWFEIPEVLCLVLWRLVTAANTGLLSLKPWLYNLLTVDDFIHSENVKNTFKSLSYKSGTVFRNMVLFDWIICEASR